MMSCTIDFADPNSEEVRVEKALEETIDKLGNIDNYDGYFMMKTEINYDEYIEREYINIYVNRYATEIKMASVITEDGEIIKQQVFIFDTSTEIRPSSYEIEYRIGNTIETMTVAELSTYSLYEALCTDGYEKINDGGDWVKKLNIIGDEYPILIDIDPRKVYWGNLRYDRTVSRVKYYSLLGVMTSSFEEALDIYKAL